MRREKCGHRAKMAIPVTMVFILAAVLSSCPNLFGDDDSGGSPGAPEHGSITVRVNEALSASSTVEPDLDTTIASYNVQLAGAGDTQTETLGPDATEVIFDDLVPGEWTVTVNAKNGDGVIIASGTQTVTVNAGETATAEITAVPVPGEGTLNLTISWPADQYSDPSIEATLTPTDPEGADSVDISSGFSITDSTAAYSHSWDAGYYQLELALHDDGAVRWGPRVVAVRIIERQTSSATYEMSGELEINIGADLNNPYQITLEGVEDFISTDASMTVSLTLDPDTAPDTIRWFLNGALQADQTTSSITVGNGGIELSPGRYFLDVLVSKGSMVSSQSAVFEVTGETPTVSGTVTIENDTENYAAGIEEILVYAALDPSDFSMGVPDEPYGSSAPISADGSWQMTIGELDQVTDLYFAVFGEGDGYVLSFYHGEIDGEGDFALTPVSVDPDTPTEINFTIDYPQWEAILINVTANNLPGTFNDVGLMLQVDWSNQTGITSGVDLVEGGSYSFTTYHDRIPATENLFLRLYIDEDKDGEHNISPTEWFSDYQGSYDGTVPIELVFSDWSDSLE